MANRITFLAWRNWTARATLTASRQVTQLPVEKLKLQQVGRRYGVSGLSAGDTISHVDLDFGREVPISVAAWLRPRLPFVDELDGASVGLIASDPVRHQFSNVASGQGEVYDSGWIPSGIAAGYGYHLHFPAGLKGEITARYARFSFDAQSRAVAPDNFVWWGWCFYGPAHWFRIGYAAPFRQGFEDGGTVQRARKSAADYRSPGVNSWRTYSVPYRSVPGDEVPALREALMATPTGAPILFCRDAANAPTETIRAKIETRSLEQATRAYERLPLPLTETY